MDAESILSNVKIDYIKHYIDSYLDKNGVYDKLNHKFNKDNLDLNNEDEVLQKLNEEGFIDNIMDSLNQNWSQEKKVESNLQGSRKGIFLKLKQGSNFNDFLKPEPDCKVVVDILFFGQRVSSKPVYAATDITFEQGFFLEFNKAKLDVRLDIDNLLRLSSPLHLVVYSYINDGKQEPQRTLLCTKTVEWRWVLCYGTWNVTAELYSSKANNAKALFGELSLSLNLLPFIDKKSLLPEKVVFDHLNIEKKYLTQKHQDFVKYANDWWEEYKTIRKSHNVRLIKLFLNTDDKENYTFKPAFTLLFPLISARSISTPYEAARFVSLIPYRRNENINNSKEEVFNSVHTMLTLKYGDIEDHCLLLCNLLLGFGLDAYIAIGVSINGPHSWVITRGMNSNEKSTGYSVVYWESLTGQKINLNDSKIFRFYKKIHCAISDKAFYANAQADDSVVNTSYVFEDESLWKTIHKDKIEGMVKYDYTPDLTTDFSSNEMFNKEAELETELKNKITSFRRSLDLNSNYDSTLAYMLSPALSNYELERVSGSTYGNEEFKQSIKNYIPEGYTFKAYPCHEIVVDPSLFFSSIIDNDIGKDILYSRGDNIKFAIRCKIVQYPQNILSVWCMVAVKYRAIK